MSKVYDYVIDRAGRRAPAKLLRLVPRGSRVLEVGCSSGSQTRVLAKELDCRITAVEVDPQAAEHARPFCENLVIGNIETMSKEELEAGGPYDVVLFADVLEHLYSPQVALEKVRSLLAPDGFLLASIPNVTHASLVFEMANGRFEYRDFGLLDSTHIRFFDRHAVLRLFEDAGYKIENIDCVKLAPANTEFRTTPIDDADRAILDYIRSRNPDSDTFQFIMRAVPARGETVVRSDLLGARQNIERLERELVEARKLLKKRESELEWLLRRPWNRLVEATRRILSRRDA